MKLISCFVYLQYLCIFFLFMSKISLCWFHLHVHALTPATLKYNGARFRQKSHSYSVDRTPIFFICSVHGLCLRTAVFALEGNCLCCFLRWEFLLNSEMDNRARHRVWNIVMWRIRTLDGTIRLAYFFGRSPLGFRVSERWEIFTVAYVSTCFE